MPYGMHVTHDSDMSIVNENTDCLIWYQITNGMPGMKRQAVYLVSDPTATVDTLCENLGRESQIRNGAHVRMRHQDFQCCERLRRRPRGVRERVTRRYTHTKDRQAFVLLLCLCERLSKL